MLRVSATLQLAAIALALAAAHARAADGASQAGIIAQCWTAEQLRQRPEEIRPQRSLAGAPVPVPRQSLAPHGREAPGAVRRVELPPGSRKLIALTFDLCETPGEIAGYDGPIFDYLRANAVKATVFAGGKWMLTHDERGQRTRQLMADPLFEVANHGWSHQNLRLLQGAALEREIEGPQAAYQAVRARLAREQCIGVPRSMSAIPERMRLMRFPFGACNREALDAVAAAGMIPIQWDISTGDPSPGTSAAAIVAEMLRARPGSIIIAHANGRGFHTAEALPIAIPKLKAKGFEFVTVSELIAAGRPVVEQQCYNARPGDTDRYDTFFRPKPRQVPASDGRNAPALPR